MLLRRRRATLSLDHEYGEEGLALSERLSDSTPNPEEACSNSEVREQLLKLSKQLSPTQRKAFQLRDLDGLTTKETAHRLGVSASTVKAQVAGARQVVADHRRDTSPAAFSNDFSQFLREVSAVGACGSGRPEETGNLVVVRRACGRRGKPQFYWVSGGLLQSSHGRGFRACGTLLTEPRG